MTSIQTSMSLRDYQRPDAVARAFGKSSGHTANGAHQRLLKLPAEFAAAIDAFVAAGATDRLARFLAPVEAALANQPTPELSLDLLTSEDVADGDEDVATRRFLMERTEENRRAALRANYRHIARLQLVARALEAEGK